MNSLYCGCTVYYVPMNNVISRGDRAASKWDSIYGCSRCLFCHILAIVLQVPAFPLNAISLTHIFLRSSGSHSGVFRFILGCFFVCLLWVFVCLSSFVLYFALMFQFWSFIPSSSFTSLRMTYTQTLLPHYQCHYCQPISTSHKLGPWLSQQSNILPSDRIFFYQNDFRSSHINVDSYVSSDPQSISEMESVRFILAPFF